LTPGRYVKNDDVPVTNLYLSPLNGSQI
jgi:hypothetical protein